MNCIAHLQTFLEFAVVESEKAIQKHQTKEVSPVVLITTWTLCIQIAIHVVEAQNAVNALQITTFGCGAPCCVFIYRHILISMPPLPLLFWQRPHFQENYNQA